MTAQSRSTPIPSIYHADNEWWEEGRQRIFADGSAENADDPRLARAGFGLFFGPNHIFNYSAIVTGMPQTSFRAESMALRHIVRTVTWPSLLVFDCLAVVDAFQLLLDGGVITSIADFDVWEDIIQADIQHFEIKWVKAHLTDAEAAIAVAAGRFSWREILANRSVDLIAKDAVALHNLPVEIIDHASVHPADASGDLDASNPG